MISVVYIKTENKNMFVYRKMDENEKSDPNFQGALQEAERVVRCLQRENDDQRREVSIID